MPKLHDYQQQALAHLQQHPRAGLFLDMGLGKTAITLRALQPEHFPALVVAPKRVAENVWETERELWRPDLDLAVAKGSPLARDRAWGRQADVTVVSRDNLGDIDPKTSRYRTIILDELSGFKSRGSQRWKRARKLTDKADYVWGLTGTPSPNGLLDLWAQMYLLDKGEALGKTLGSYRSRYFTPGRQLPNGVIIEYLLRPGADKRIHKLLEPTCISMSTVGRLDLPPVNFNLVDVRLPPKARKAYDEVKQNLTTNIDLFGTITAANSAVLSGKLAQISAGFVFSDEYYGGQYLIPDEDFAVLHKEKIDAVLDIIAETGSPVLVLYRFRPELQMLQQALGSLAHTIQEPGILKRWDRGEIPVLLAHPDSIGHGLNMQRGGHTAIWTTLPWSLEAWDQSNKRLARQGQQHPVVIHVIRAKGTVDADIYRALRDKKSVQQALLDHLEIR